MKWLLVFYTVSHNPTLYATVGEFESRELCVLGGMNLQSKESKKDSEGSVITIPILTTHFTCLQSSGTPVR